MGLIRRLFQKKKKNKDEQNKSNSNVILRSLTDVYENAHIDDHVTENNFIQGRLGNCTMISSMASLATNHEIYSKMVTIKQNDPTNKVTEQNDPTNRKPTQFVFNLFKRGKYRRVVVDDCLSFLFNELYFSRSWNRNFVGPLLEKALMQLHFDGNYKSAEGIDCIVFLTSFTNNIFESYRSDSHLNLSYRAHEVIKHGIDTKSLMVVSFEKCFNEYSLITQHEYTIIDMSKEFVKLYNPYGKTVLVPKYYFFDCLSYITICYFENKVFEMPIIKDLMEFTESWCPYNEEREFLYISFNLDVEEDNTVLVVNLLGRPGLKMHTSCVRWVENELICDYKMPITPNNDYRWQFDTGVHMINFEAFAFENTEIYEDIVNNLNEEENKMFLRFASSKHCIMEKYVEEECL